ncbi:MAG: tRNA (N(6)-L-threonylcarbamoyladenosine(37)-C(2))-methylthiotransferase MtaB [Ignavibacteriaceae bacterium]|nr:tRNA (N(6)-L-threonylcarbamoyladenosine(37)-C(2))-methylthiotransferase MtaB [Ignavibacteriaceae bacterium]HRN25925.1 tRNA (N(6)-L-threonylcarbamoyladenosine(37)-C(2))-methylthiotransferase MtaB [Ignavibacteriaceae bacterium]HRQ54080.1 tRNA (N(6)-L-threonylcarbamoyladenosine(37)-C(2))-methylthiotransferase MtaB [Ignavibacteriaceae bacterium]
MPQTVALHTLGCKLNFSETSTIGNHFLQNGFSVVDMKNRADVYVFNTCSVTENAEKECRQLVRRVLRTNPQAYVIVTGCYAQLRADEIAAIDGVDAVLGSNEKFEIFSLIKDFNKKDLSCIYVSPKDELNKFGLASSTDADSRTRAYFKIQDGCDYKCTFCTIPLARGKSRSMNPDLVVEDFKNLVKQGYKEIILTGVNVGDYGKSFELDFFLLLKKLIQVEGNFRIRISSIEPNLLTDDIINLTAKSEKMCKHFHIPLQSGSDTILHSMQRRYSVDDYKNVILKVKEMIPDAGIGVDVIVGYPGETEKEFMETYNFLLDLPISYLHVFTYSERPDTKAILIADQVDPAERKRRNKMLRILSDKKKNYFYNQMIGKTVDVLFESEDPDGTVKGFSSNYVRVQKTTDKDLENRMCKVNIEGIRNGLLYGEIKEIKNSVALELS